MFNILPGQGLGFSGPKEIAFGLGAIVVSEIPIIPPTTESGGGGGRSDISVGGFLQHSIARVYDNAYSKPNDDHEVIELLSILFQVIE